MCPFNLLSTAFSKKVQGETGVEATSSVVLVLTTLGADADAEAFARTLVEESLAACVNVLPPMRSVYTWQGRLEQEQERQVVIKTTDACLPRLEARVKALHSYDVPEFLVVRVSGGSAAYLAWVAASVAS